MERISKNENENATEASFIVSLHIAKAGKPHTIAETLIKSCVKDVVSCMLGPDMAKKIDTVQLSNSTISKRIYTISESVENELIRRLKTCEFFSLQLDESTDVAGLAVLLVFVRYPFEMQIEEELLMSEVHETYTTGDEIFKAIDKCVQKNDLEWSKCVDICSDGAAAMVGKVKGAVSRMKQVAGNATSSHCVIHRHSLATRRMPQDLKVVLDGAVKIINHVKSCPLQAHLLKLTTEDLGMDHFHLLLHTEVWWLSRGNFLARLFELKDALVVTFTEEPFIQQLTDVDWLLKLGYLSDIFEKLNETTTSLQGKGGAQLEKIKDLRKIITFFKACVESRDISNFPRLQEFVKTNEINLQTNFLEMCIAHLQGLERSIVDYFPDIDSDDIYSWMMNPFFLRPET
uniref:zinc finger BED domain-containing protein 5-like n=1 Tax=Euleptes europaea TaxID=460621 RepID=UPI0025407872|nr:zinc finger BED domain-containing protein 5-like [Euleptes europaea]